MKTILCLLVLIAALTVGAQNINVVIISGAGNAADNGTYVTNMAAGGYTNFAGITMQPDPIHTYPFWVLDGGYFSSNFPTVWFDVGFGGWPPPDPTGAYLTISSATAWSISLTNFWTVPGDSVTFGASGLNMATTGSPAGLVALLDGGILYTSTFTAGKGHPFSLNGHIFWDGTNLYSSASMQAGDPSNVQVAQFGQFNNHLIGTNAFQLLTINNTNGLVIQSASINASRTPAGTYLPATNTVISPGAFMLQ